jgi:hypothetical protein
MLFDQSAPLSAVAQPPSYYTGDPTKLKLLGYNTDGTRNTWGKLLGWHPMLAGASNLLAKNEFSTARATDALANQQQWAQRDFQKGMFAINTSLAIGGAIAGNPQLAGQGAIGMSRTAGNLLNPVPITQSNPQITYLNPYNF